ncbi:T9SS type A sorting domain-containing protein [Flavobacterium wongokense]|uniref:T9SS type A sorting domain-containing protein n=1 Tax=Flavobacterium wongokense TaxID=2910674 RepID=UPI001F341E48|nr:T9SS type A sorting domain-containing protein [Flavobacterium sp. WG47]MCF6132646.1 T9SS type A sorting domain-containing protein [Flavobacterium sp. WG47]
MEDKPVGWNGGRGVIGLVNTTTQAIAAPGRNAGNWNASQEAWRFYRSGYFPNYSFVRCDDNADGIQTFDLSVAANDLYPNPAAVSFFETQVDAQAQVNPIANPNAYLNISNPMTIYTNINSVVRPVTLSVIDCSIDADNDSVPTSAEDINNDTNLANDDTDFDGIPNYSDNDDDGDLVLTSVEYVFFKTNVTQSANILLDTDNDGIPNYLDKDDDGDGLLTWREDYNHNGNPSDDDTNSNGTADYLESAVALGTSQVSLTTAAIKVYPNPTSDLLNIQNNTEDVNASIEIYSINGSKIKSLKATEALTTISVAELQAGVYFVKVTMNNQVGNYKFIKN